VGTGGLYPSRTRLRFVNLFCGSSSFNPRTRPTLPSGGYPSSNNTEGGHIQEVKTMIISRKRIIGFVCIAVFLIAHACNASDIKIGVVLLHGKNGTPTSSHVSLLASKLDRNGFVVIAPEMPYSKSRFYSKSYEDTMVEIDTAVNELKKRGAKKIFIAGHSLGANVALHYATTASVDGVLALAPGHTPELKGFQTKIGDSVDRARKMVKEGKGDERYCFNDVNQGKTSSVCLAAKTYLSWFDPEGSAVIPKNAAAIKPGTALLWVVGTKDQMYEKGPSYAFDKAPANTHNKYIVVKSDHMNTPGDAAEEIIQWLKGFEAADK
jgi:esterase/lipase